MTTLQRRVLVVAVLASFVSFLDGTVVSVALPAIARELGGAGRGSVPALRRALGEAPDFRLAGAYQAASAWHSADTSPSDPRSNPR